MSLAVHIPFYNPNPKKKEGFRELTREEYLVENIINLKTLNIKKDIFIHTHNDFIDHLSITLFKVFINQPYEYYFHVKSSDLIRDINSEPSGLIKNLFVPLCIIIMESIILIGLIFFLVFYYGGKVGLALFITLGIVIICLYFTRNTIKKWGGIRFEFETQRIKSITQRFDNIKDIIIKKKIQFFFNKFQKFTKSVTKASFYGGFYRTLPKILIEQLVLILFIIYFLYYYNVFLP